jgi:hypothetical protein
MLIPSEKVQAAEGEQLLLVCMKEDHDLISTLPGIFTLPRGR